MGSGTLSGNKKTEPAPQAKDCSGRPWHNYSFKDGIWYSHDDKGNKISSSPDGINWTPVK